MFIATLFIIAKKQKPPKYPSIGEWIKQNVVYIHTMGYYLAMKRNEVLIHTTDESWKTAC